MFFEFISSITLRYEPSPLVFRPCVVNLHCWCAIANGRNMTRFINVKSLLFSLVENSSVHRPAWTTTVAVMWPTGDVYTRRHCCGVMTSERRIMWWLNNNVIDEAAGGVTDDVLAQRLRSRFFREVPCKWSHFTVFKKKTQARRVPTSTPPLIHGSL